MLKESVKACKEIDEVIKGRVLAYEMVINDDGNCIIRPKLIPAKKSLKLIGKSH